MAYRIKNGLAHTVPVVATTNPNAVLTAKQSSIGGYHDASNLANNGLDNMRPGAYIRMANKQRKFVPNNSNYRDVEQQVAINEAFVSHAGHLDNEAMVDKNPMINADVKQIEKIDTLPETGLGGYTNQALAGRERILVAEGKVHTNLPSNKAPAKPRFIIDHDEAIAAAIGAPAKHAVNHNDV